jgi:16S rRNA (cytosine967-C5)-methyltransferase
MIAPARVAAYDILTAVSSGNADLPTAMAFARAGLRDDRDRALASEIATGVLRWRASLDHLIAGFSKRSLDRLDPEIVEILRLGAYQLLHLTRVPASAVVDDAVNLARRAGKSSAAGFVNAVLRTISRKRARLPLPPRPSNPADRSAALDYFSITLSHPKWLVARWYERHGFEATERWLMFNNEPPPLTLRANRLRIGTDDLIRRLDDADVRVHPSALVPGALIVDEGSAIAAAEQGIAAVQDEASQLVGWFAADAGGTRVLDTCASPGGKTVMIAARMNGDGLLVASDVRDRRMALLRRTIESSGATNVRLVQTDLLTPLPFAPVFDLVFLDAPCSGLGTLRRDPDIRWRRRESDLTSFAAAELTMAQHAAAVVAPGGRLIYATCSSEPEENEAIVDALLATTPALTPLHARDVSSAIPDAVIDARGHLRTEPHRHRLEAFFAAAFQRQKIDT